MLDANQLQDGIGRRGELATERAVRVADHGTTRMMLPGREYATIDLASLLGRLATCRVVRARVELLRHAARVSARCLRYP